MLFTALAAIAISSDPVTLSSLLAEMGDRTALARLPQYELTQASTYNRASVRRGEDGWFADGDGTGFIRTEDVAAPDGSVHTEWVIMDQAGPGAIVKMWAPYFYYDLGNRTGPTIRIYLDHDPRPALEANWIELLTNHDWRAQTDMYGSVPADMNSFHIPAPLSSFTARAGNCYLPIPFARACKVTFDQPPFYTIINARAYPQGTAVESFSMTTLTQCEPLIARTCAALHSRPVALPAEPHPAVVAPGATVTVMGPQGPHALHSLAIHIDPDEIAAHPELLRSTILRMSFDGEETVWCPLGDFFGSPNGINPFTTQMRCITAEGNLTAFWVMPYAQSARITLENLSATPLTLRHIGVTAEDWTWDERSLHFAARWRADWIQPGDQFLDWNFIEATGAGVLVGDQWTVLNPTTGWWGEGDEKIYVDDAWERGFPDHFGTGSEDYYGWAGGVNPTWNDVFSHPFLSNIAVGSASGDRAEAGGGTTRGYNICTRQRALDALPFTRRLTFDMELSPGVEQRAPTDLLGYSAVTFLYLRPGAQVNLPPNPAAAQRPLMDLDHLSPGH